MTEKHFWKVHTPNLIAEVLKNPGTAILTQPMRIFGNILAAVAERAIELDDPQLNILMLRLALYDQGDPTKHSPERIEAQLVEQRRRLQATPDFRAAITATLPPPDTDARRDWLQTAMEVIADTIYEHAKTDQDSAMIGLMILYNDHGSKRIRSAGGRPLASVDNPAATSESS